MDKKVTTSNRQPSTFQSSSKSSPSGKQITPKMKTRGTQRLILGKVTCKKERPSTSQNNKSNARRKQSTPKKRSSHTKLVVLGKNFKIDHTLLTQIQQLAKEHNLIGRRLFSTLLKQTTLPFRFRHMKIQGSAIDTLWFALQMYLSNYFEDCNLYGLNCRKVTVSVM